MRVPLLRTARLVIRPFEPDDLDAIHRILDRELSDADFGTEGVQTRDERREWLTWSIMNYEQLGQLNQPPYGDRAVVVKDTNELVGACGFVPCLAPFGQLPSWRVAEETRRSFRAEFGLYYAISPAHQRRGYATEATRALIEYALNDLCLHRIVATTTHDNAASMAVMRKLGMRIERNPDPDPPWFQVVGVLESGGRT
ncbi:MAG: GNAT family N-acetyltransferase [Deltaproteobacteria bacterium]|nr:GNAT family N-acetyltransferase [Deltaproteobacteria bacterium]MBI3388092.1 GNAT family N-acetyltransferase [Deltaproteobacteria bacterium]